MTGTTFMRPSARILRCFCCSSARRRQNEGAAAASMFRAYSPHASFRFLYDLAGRPAARGSSHEPDAAQRADRNDKALDRRQKTSSNLGYHKQKMSADAMRDADSEPTDRASRSRRMSEATTVRPASRAPCKGRAATTVEVRAAIIPFLPGGGESSEARCGAAKARRTRVA
jgi:hypothetical protein